MTPAGPQLDLLEQRIEQLRREYDLFLAGNRKGAPVALHDEVEREIVRLTRLPASSTATQFRLRGLAHRFQALANQTRQRIESRRAAHAPLIASRVDPEPSVLLDRAAVANPAAVEVHLKRMHGAVATQQGGNKLSLERLRERLLDEARKQLEQQPDICGVRFRVVTEQGVARLRGEVVSGKKA